MNIVFVSKECPPSPRSCGIGTYVWETGRALARAGHQVTIIAASDDGELASSTPLPRMTVIRLPDDELGVENRRILARTLHAPLGQGIAYRRRVADRIASLIDTQRPDVIEFPGFRGESAIWLTGQRLLPMVVRMHGFTAGISWTWKDHLSATKRLQISWEREEVRSADVITAVSENHAALARARFGADRVYTLHNSIDADQWSKLSEGGSLGIGANDLLFVGSLLINKGIVPLLHAGNLLRQAGWQGRLILAGRTTPQFERAIRIRPSLGMKLPDWVVHLGVCQRERLATMYRNAGACCFPSLVEPFSYTCLEAMACGGIVIGSLKTGMAEVLTETCGFMVPPGDVSKLAAAIRSALSMNDKERRQRKEAAQQRVRDKFDNKVIIPKLLDTYQNTINSYNGRC